MGSSRSISVEDPDAVRRRMQRLRELAESLPSGDQIRSWGGTQSVHASNYTSPLWMRGYELSSVTEQLAARLEEFAAQVDKTVEALVKSDQEAEDQARRLNTETPSLTIRNPAIRFTAPGSPGSGFPKGG